MAKIIALAPNITAAPITVHKSIWCADFILLGSPWAVKYLKPA